MFGVAGCVTSCETVCSFSQIVDGHFTLSFSQQLAVAVKDIRQFLCPPPSAETSDHGEDAALRLEPSSFNAGMLCAMCSLLTFAADEVGCRVKEVCCCAVCLSLYVLLGR